MSGCPHLGRNATDEESTYLDLRWQAGAYDICFVVLVPGWNLPLFLAEGINTEFNLRKLSHLHPSINNIHWASLVSQLYSSIASSIIICTRALSAVSAKVHSPITTWLPSPLVTYHPIIFSYFTMDTKRPRNALDHHETLNDAAKMYAHGFGYELECIVEFEHNKADYLYEIAGLLQNFEDSIAGWPATRQDIREMAFLRNMIYEDIAAVGRMFISLAVRLHFV